MMQEEEEQRKILKIDAVDAAVGPEKGSVDRPCEWLGC
jgi:hypothetical protein